MKLPPLSASPSDQIEDLLSEHSLLEDVPRDLQDTLNSGLDLLPEGVVDALRGEWLGHPLHPALVHLPLGGWMIAGVLDHLPVGQTEAERQRTVTAWAEAPLMVPKLLHVRGLFSLIWK